jgi:hypothetical protein
MSLFVDNLPINPDDAGAVDAFEEVITPDIMHEVDAELLQNLSSAAKSRLNTLMTNEQRELLNDDQAAALDIYGAEVPYLGDVHGALEPPIARHIDGIGGVHIEANGEDRFYAIIIGVNFTGVVRGNSNFMSVAPQSLRFIKGFRARSRVHAEAMWRRAAYRGECGTIPPPQPPVMVTPHVVRFNGPAL